MPNAKSSAVGAIIVLVLVVLVYAAFRLFCATGAQLAGFWSTPRGEFFEIRGRPGSGCSVTTASGFLEAGPDRAYSVEMKGCRSVSIAFPAGVLRGRAGLDRRRIIWDGAPTWFRQGI
jgi:hypothetical protein